MSAPRCLVLGGTGFVGSAVAAEAARRGWDVAALSSKTAAEAVGGRFDLVVNANGNARKYLAWQDPALDFDLSVRTVARSLHEIRADRYVFLSSSEVYNDPADPGRNAEDAPVAEESLSPYGFHKRLAERLVRRYAPRWLILRCSGLVGPNLRKNAVFDLLTGAPLRLAPASTFQFLDTRVLAGLLFDLLDRPEAERAVFNAGGSGIVSLREVADWAGAALPDEVGDLPETHCELNVGRLARLCALPASDETVRAFVREWRAGRAAP